MSEDYYTLLGVDRDASEAAILEAYRRKAAEHHPDVSDDADADETFRRLNRAKAVLTDEDRRRTYNRLGHDQFVSRDEPASSTASQRESSTTWGTEGQSAPSPNLGEASDLRFILETMLGAGSSTRVAQAGPQRDGWPGPFEVDLTSVFRGSPAPMDEHGNATSRTTSAADSETDDCPNCRGRGSFVHLIDTARGRHERIEPCERCGGSGTVSES